MDLSKLSIQDLMAMRDGDLSKVSDQGLQHMRGPSQTEMPEVPEAEISPTESAVLGAGNSALAGLGKPLLAGASALQDKLQGSDRSLGQLYDDNAPVAEEALGMAAKSNPLASGAASAAGAILSPLNTLGAAGGAISGGIRGYQAGQDAGQNPLAAAGLGAATGALVNKGLGMAGQGIANAVNKTAIYAKPVTDAIQRETDTVTATFPTVFAKLLTGQPVQAAKGAAKYVSGNIAQIVAQTPERLGEFSTVLSNAAQRGTLPVTTYILNQMSPKFRQTMANMEGDEDKKRGQ